MQDIVCTSTRIQYFVCVEGTGSTNLLHLKLARFFFECSFPWPVNILQSLVALNSWVEWLSPVWVLYAKIVIANVFIMITELKTQHQNDIKVIMAGHLYLKGTHVQYSRLCSSSHQMIIILYGKHRERVSIRTW